MPTTKVKLGDFEAHPKAVESLLDLPKNWALGQVKKDLDPKKTDPNHVQVPWALEAFCKRWNQVKDEVAPWWAKNSKECYQAGIADATSALWNCSASKHNKRKGRQVGFLALSRRGGLRTEFA